MEIPGYYYDSRTRRYFKQDPAHPRPSILEADGNSSPTISATDRPKKRMVDLLYDRELGNYGASFRSSIFSLQAQSLRFLTNLECFSTSFRSDVDEEITYVKGAGDHHFVERKYGKEYNVLSIVAGILQPESHHTVSLYPSYVVDLCENQKREYTCLVQSDSFWSDSRLSVGRRFRVSVVRTPNILFMQNSMPCKLPIWCCSMECCTEKFLTGETSKVGVWDVHQLTRSYSIRISKGDVHALQCSKSSSLCFVGVNTGHFRMVDLRNRTNVHGNKLHSKGINELVLLQDENSIIMGGFDGWICNFDLRMQRKLFEYYGHKHTIRKTPFSVSEQYDVLSATGSDGLTRIWSLSRGGHPIKTIVPPEKGSPCHSCISEHNRQWNLLLYQGKSVSIYGIKDLVA